MNTLTLHFTLMFIAFAILIPVATILTRYYKVTPKQDFPKVYNNRFWWKTHLFLMITATVMMSLALYVITTGKFESYHAKLGLITATLVYLQFVSGMLRGTEGLNSDLSNNSKRRRIFELYHKTSGWLILLFGGVTMGFGFFATENWVHLTLLVLMWIGYNYWIADCMGAKRHVDTWRATFGEKE